ncbi:MAG: hypothetical protein ACI3V0_01665 [Faecousia sp.]
MGRRGPKPGTGGRPKKAIADRIEDGNPGRRPLTVIDFGDSAADLEGQEMPKPSEFLSARQKDGSTLCAAEIYENVWKWLAERGCAALVSPQLMRGSFPAANSMPCNRSWLHNSLRYGADCIKMIVDFYGGRSDIWS